MFSWLTNLIDLFGTLEMESLSMLLYNNWLVDVPLSVVFVVVTSVDEPTLSSIVKKPPPKLIGIITASPTTVKGTNIFNLLDCNCKYIKMI